MVNGIYGQREEPIILDNGRLWAYPDMIDTMEHIYGDVKIVATVRPVTECAASFVKLESPENVSDFIATSSLITHLKWAHNILVQGFLYKPENFCIIHYDDLIHDTQDALDKIADFLGVDHHTHDLDNIPPFLENTAAYSNTNKDLHRVGRSLMRPAKDETATKELLGEAVFEEFDRMAFPFK